MLGSAHIPRIMNFGFLSNVVRNFSIAWLFVFCHSHTFPAFSQRYEITQYTTEEGLIQNNINQLIFDRNHHLWISTNGGLCVFDGQKIVFSSSHVSTLRPHRFISDNNDHIYFNRYEPGAYRININNFQISEWAMGVPHHKVAFNKKKIRKHPVPYLYDFDQLWRPDENEVIKIIHGQRLRNDATVVDKKNSFEFMMRSYESDVVIGKTGPASWLLYKKDANPTPIKTDIPNDILAEGLIFTDETDAFYLYKKEIFRINLINDQLVSESILKDVPIDKKIHNLTSGTYHADTGFFYFGSATEGLFEIKQKPFKTIIHSDLEKPTPYIPNERKYYNQALLPNGKILVNNYLVIDSTKFLFNKHVERPFFLALNHVDDSGRLWFSEKERLVVIKNEERYMEIQGPEINELTSIAQGPSPQSYFLLKYKGLLKISGDKIDTSFSLTDIGLNNLDDGRFIFKISSDKYYILTNKNIYEFDSKLLKSRRIQDLPDAEYRNMSKLKPNLYFVGTYGQGFFLFDGQNWKSMPLDEQEHLKFAHVALTDDQSHVWISTNNGLFRTRMIDLENYFQGKTSSIFYYRYDKSDGFLTNEFNGGVQSPAIRLHDGGMSFSSMKGLVQFNPCSVTTLFPKRNLYIRSIKLNDEQMNSVPRNLTLTQDIDDILIEVGAVHYGHSQNLMIEYRLMESDHIWKKLDKKQYIRLQNLTHGDYTIEIRIRVGFGEEEFKNLTYCIKVLPYYYQNGWFHALALLCLGAFIFFGTRWYSRFTMRKNLELERIINEQKQDLVAYNLELKEKIKQNDLFQSIFVHDIKSPLRFIESNSKLLLKNKQYLNPEIIFDHLHHINEASSKINRFVDETVLWIKIRNGEFKAQKTNFPFSELLNEVIKFHAENEKIITGEVTIQIICEKNFNCDSDPMFLDTILRNLLSNSLKHTEKGAIILYGKTLKGKSFRVGCKDTGVGIPKDVVDMLINQDYQGNSIRNDSFRLGYVIIKELTRILGGRLHIESTLGVGTNVYIDFE